MNEHLHKTNSDAFVTYLFSNCIAVLFDDGLAIGVFKRCILNVLYSSDEKISEWLWIELE